LANFSDVEAPERSTTSQAQREKRFLVLAAFWSALGARRFFERGRFRVSRRRSRSVPKSDSESFSASASAGATGSSPHTLAAR